MSCIPLTLTCTSSKIRGVKNGIFDESLASDHYYWRFFCVTIFSSIRGALSWALDSDLSPPKMVVSLWPVPSLWPVHKNGCPALKFLEEHMESTWLQARAHWHTPLVWLSLNRGKIAYQMKVSLMNEGLHLRPLD